tara:strand:+ start:105 stop:608 length:504 start_codon:yes stop_codon:yes gene_type:complete
MKKLLILLLLPLTIFSQTNWCDSISYSVLPNPNGVFSVMIETTDSLDNYCDTVDVAWGVCNTSLCFSGFGAWASFPIIQLTDTVKVCYNAYIMNPPQQTIACSDVCDTIVYNGFEWVSFPMSNTVGWEEILPNGQHKGVVYDLKGRVVTDIKKNTIYIRNMKKFIKF